MRHRFGTSAFVLTLLLTTAVTAQGRVASHVSPSATLEPDPVGVDQIAMLTIQVESSGLDNVSFEPRFELENLQKIGTPSRSQSVRFVNGRVGRTDTLTWRLRPIETGAGRVHAIRVEIDQKIFVLDDLTITIQKEPVALPNRRRRALRSPFEEFDDLWDPYGRQQRGQQALPAVEPKVFLRAEVTPRSPYVGQQVVYTLYLFTQADVGAIDPDELPDFQGAWVHEIPQPRQQKATMTKVQDVDYGRVILLRKALFPLRPGPLEIGPVSARLVIKIPEQSWLGPLLDRSEEIQRTSNSVSLEVRELPAAPEDYAGAVGKLKLEATLDPQELRVGEAATLTVSLSGDGHIQGLDAPPLAEMDGLRRFSPEQEGGDEIVGTRVRGHRSWTYVLVPDRPGEWELPSIRYPFFDPKSGEFVTAATEPLTLRALPNKQAPVPVPVADNEPSPEENEVVAASTRWMSNPWLLGLAVLLPLLIGIVLKGTRTTSRRRRDCRFLKERLRAANELKPPRRAADEIEGSWRSFLSHRLNVEHLGPPNRWGDLLEEKGASPASVEQMDRLAEDLDYLRHAPELAAADSVRTEILERSARLLRALS